MDNKKKRKKKEEGRAQDSRQNSQKTFYSFPPLSPTFQTFIPPMRSSWRTTPLLILWKKLFTIIIIINRQQCTPTLPPPKENIQPNFWVNY